jgi:predicted ATPase
MEAVAHLTRGLEVLKTLPDTPERVRQELILQLALGTALFAVKGYTALEVEKTYTRARELCQQVGETPQLFPMLWSLVVFYNNRPEYQTARELAEQLMRLAQSAQDQKLLASAHSVLGWTLYSLGELTSARTLLEQGIALYEPRTPSGRDDPRVQCLSYASWTLWQLGYADQALQRSQEAVALARGLPNPHLLAYTLAHAARFHLLRREGSLAQERAEAVITLSTEQGFPFWLAFGTRARGSALAEQGQIEEGIVQMQQGLAGLRAIGTEAGRPIYLADLTTAYGKVGQIEEGLNTLAEALDLVQETGACTWEAELYRLRGELMLAQSRVQRLESSVQKEAEEYFHKAIEIARRQSAKSLELRAVMSLSCLWQQQGKQKEAHEMLSGIYNWFTEGFDTKDLQEAKALLTALT